MLRPSLLDHFSALDDPRQRGKVLYPLPEIMLLILCATLSGAEDFVETRVWGLKKLRFLRGMLPFVRGIPSHDTVNDVMNALDGDLFAQAFTAWVDGLREAEADIVAIDGKTSRRAHAGGHPLHMVSAWAARQRLVLGQEATEAKSNEISAIPLLLERLQLTGALVTIDVGPGSATGSSDPARGHPDQDRRLYSGTRGRLSSRSERQPEKPGFRGRTVLRCARSAWRDPYDHRWRPWPDRDPQALGQHLGRLTPIRPQRPRRAALSGAESHRNGRSRGRARWQNHPVPSLLPVVAGVGCPAPGPRRPRAPLSQIGGHREPPALGYGRGQGWETAWWLSGAADGVRSLLNAGVGPISEWIVK